MKPENRRQKDNPKSVNGVRRLRRLTQIMKELLEISPSPEGEWLKFHKSLIICENLRNLWTLLSFAG
jgi:hypothetical protein